MEKIRISLEKTKLFGIVPVNASIEKDEIGICVKSIEQKTNILRIKIEILNLTEKPQAKTLTYDQEKLTPYEATFLGWAFILLDNYKNSYKERGKKFLVDAIKTGVDSCLPYYLLFHHNLENHDDYEKKWWLYKGAEKKDVFPDFFRLLFRKEENRIKALGFVKKGLRKFPHDLGLVTIWASHLRNEGRFEETLRFLTDARPLSFGDRYWGDYESYQFFVFEGLIKLRKFDEADKFLGSVMLSRDKFCFLKGLLYFEKKDYEQASEFFTKSIEEDASDEVVTASLYYLLACYVETRNGEKVEGIIQLLPHEGELLLITEFSFFYENTAKRILEKALELPINEVDKAKAKGIIGLIILMNELPKFDGGERKLTSEEVRSLNYALRFIRESLEYYPYSRTFNGICSDLLYLKKDYDNSFKYRVRGLLGNEKEEYYTNAELKKCSDGFLNNYCSYLKREIGNDDKAINKYIQRHFEFDIKDLYERRKYEVISEVFNWLKDNLNLNKAGEIYRGGLFEIAYSLKIVGSIEQAKYIYEKMKEMNRGSSSVLNNLAIIYEEEGKLQKAREYIKKAKQLTKGEDEIINTNFARLVAKSKKLANRSGAIATERGRPRKHTPKAGLPEFDKNTGDITFGKKKCHIANPGNYQYHICEMLLLVVKPGELVTEEEIEDKYTSVGTFKSPRWVKDAVYKINDKVEKSFGIRQLIIYKNSNLRLRKEILE